MKKYVAAFGSKYLRRYEIKNGLVSITLIDDLFDAIELDRKNYSLLAQLIDLGADIKEVTFYESIENWDIKNELKEETQ